MPDDKATTHRAREARDLAPTSGSRRVSANELRWLAEEADGKREKPDDDPLEIVWKPVKGQWRLGLAPKGSSPVDSVVAGVDVFTPFQGDGMRADAKVALIRDGSDPHILSRVKNGVTEYPDAVFLTQSSFAKFVIPYYARFRTPAALTTMTRKYFQDSTTLAMIHFPPSEDEAVLLAEVDDNQPLTNVLPLRLVDGKLSCGEPD